MIYKRIEASRQHAWTLLYLLYTRNKNKTCKICNNFLVKKFLRSILEDGNRRRLFSSSRDFFSIRGSMVHLITRRRSIGEGADKVHEILAD